MDIANTAHTTQKQHQTGKQKLKKKDLYMYMYNYTNVDKPIERYSEVPACPLLENIGR